MEDIQVLQRYLRCHRMTKPGAAPSAIRYSTDILWLIFYFFSKLQPPRHTVRISVDSIHQPHGNCAPRQAWWLTPSKIRFPPWIPNSHIIHKIAPFLGCKDRQLRLGSHQVTQPEAAVLAMNNIFIYGALWKPCKVILTRNTDTFSAQ